jgi:hypothetical protein
MGILHPQSNRIVIDLDVSTSGRLLEQAVRCRAAIDLVIHAPDLEDHLVGCVASVDRDALQISALSAPGDILPSVYADGTMQLHGQEYLFSTSIINCERRAHDIVIDVVRPAMLQTWQRRRFMRASVADSTDVQIFPRDGAGESVATGRVLNLSPGGLAMRLDARQADQLTIESCLQLRFALRPGGEAFVLDAEVRTKTPGGSPGTIIVGVQFTDAACNLEARRILSETLRAYP